MQPLSSVGDDSSEAATTAPLPRSVFCSAGTPKAGSTAVPVTRIVRVTAGPGLPPIQVTRTRTDCPTATCSARIVWAPRAISPGLRGARPSSNVRYPPPRTGSTAIAGTLAPSTLSSPLAPAAYPARPGVPDTTSTPRPAGTLA